MPFSDRPLRIAVAGNPNTGKTTLFNRLTGSRAKVGNYPGVTVDRRVGKLELPLAGSVEVIDVPGTYSLAARSAEEQVAISAVAGLPPYERPDLVVAVVDATNLVRNLYLVLQLIELGTPLVVALNMMDVLEASGQEVDVRMLEQILEVPVVDVVALRGEGIDALLRVIDDTLRRPERAIAPWHWDPEEEPLLAADVRAVERAIPESWAEPGTPRARALALWALLSVDDHDELLAIPPALRDVVERKRRLADASGRHIEEEIIQGRYDWLDRVAPRFLRDRGAPVTFTDRADRILLHPALGFVVFLGLMTVVFQSLFAWADPVIGLIERAFGTLGDWAATTLPAGLPSELLVDGVLSGVGSVLVFLPQILLLFFFIGVMEDTGYMARVAYLMDRVMKLLGLHGRAFVPMLSGYACAVPAILATRTMERRRDRLLTMMVVPLMTCSARLPVYGLLIAAMVPPGAGHAPVQGLLLAGMYLFSTVVTLIAAAVLGRTVLPGKRTPLLLEMPPYRMPHWPSLLRMLWERCWVFLREAGTVILVCTIAIWVLLSFPRTSPESERLTPLYEQAQAKADSQESVRLEREISGANLRASYGGRIGRAIEPAIAPLGFDWEIGVGLLGAFAAREVFVSTMAVVYDLDAETDSASSALRDQLRSQTRPDGSPLYTPLVCLSLMIFFALACQCMSTLAVVKRETKSWRWPIFLFSYMGVLAWVASFVVYQGGRLLGFE